MERSLSFAAFRHQGYYSGMSSWSLTPSEKTHMRTQAAVVAARLRRSQPGGLQFRLSTAHMLIGLFPPFVANRLRMAALRACGFAIGNGSIFWGMPTIIGSGNIYERLHIGVECGFNVGNFFELEAPVTIADHTRVGHDVMFLTASYGRGDQRQRAGRPTAAPIVVESGVWIGARCTIMPGVTIGAGSVIGATLVVDKDVPANTLLMGTQKISLAKWR
jgi:acetyltransferase-like isoleucine patch superfamily enzyme